MVPPAREGGAAPPGGEAAIASVLLAEDLDKAYADRTVLRGATFAVGAGEHVGLVGANGSGKSTLLAILAGELEPDRGRLVRTGRVARLAQDPVLAGPIVEDAVRQGLGGRAEPVPEHRIDAMLDRLEAPPRDAPIAPLSGGERRRVALATTLLAEPDVLLLDEPTNHLDARATGWLEGWLAGFRGAVVLVTHDRYLLEAVADRIVEVEGGETVSSDGSYGDYLVARAERQARLQQHRERLLATIAREAAWAARSPSARRTKQKARLQRLDQLRDEVPELSDPDLAFSFATGVPRGVTLVELHGVRKAFGERVLFDGVDDVLRPGDRVGVLGSNGAGKSTLLKLVTGELEPDRGTVLRASRAKIGVLDQARSGLAPGDTVFEAAGGGHDHLVVGGVQVHVAGFLQRFAFARESFGQRVSLLSGGERARLLLAKLMLEGANVLLLDEPTNDLDLQTLRVLEEALVGFDGALLAVSHDRAFVDRVCTRVLAFEPGARVVAYASREQAGRAVRVIEEAERPAAPARPKAASARLSYKEQRELDALPDRIEALEAEQARLEALLADPATYRERGAEVRTLGARLEALPAEIASLFARWDELARRG